MASLLNEAPSTVQSWKNKGLIPAQHHQKVLDTAIENAIPLTPAHFFANPGPAEAVAPPPAARPALPGAGSASIGARATPMDGILMRLAADGVIDPSNAPRQPFTILYRPGSAKGELLPDTVPPPMDGRIQRWEPEGTDGWKLVFDSHGPITSDEAA